MTHRQRKKIIVNLTNDVRTWQWLTLGLILFMAVATAYMIAIVGGVL